VQQRQTIWHPTAFVICHIMMAVLFGSWLFPPTRAILDSIDTWLFFTLNGSLSWGEGWQLIWAYGNTFLADVVVGSLMILVFMIFCFSGEKYTRVERLSAFGIIPVMILVSQDGGLSNYYVDLIDISRASPSITLEPVIRLSELHPGIDLKDFSNSSFPGDHGIVVLIWLSCLLYYGGWRWGSPALLFTVLILLPRMIAGAHWLTDNLVGSATLVLFMDAWILFTPVAYYLNKLGNVILGKLLPRSWGA